MARPLRLEFVGALYYVPFRGDRREDIYLVKRVESAHECACISVRPL